MRPREEQPVVRLILRDLAFGPSTVKDLEAAVGVDKRNLREYLKLLHKRRKIHVCGWERTTGRPLPVWRIGSADDKPYVPTRPKTLTESDR